VGVRADQLPQRHSRRPLDRPDINDAERVLVEAYPAVAPSVSRVRHAMVGFAEQASASAETVEAIRLVASEAAANVVEHAYRGEPGPLHVTAMLDSEAIWLVISDEGRGLTIDRHRPGLGVGFSWMAIFSDAMTVDSAPGGGLEITLRFLR
jgi:anti-sigma regulatory factor (Ser/Thr protein kinase)